MRTKKPNRSDGLLTFRNSSPISLKGLQDLLVFSEYPVHDGLCVCLLLPGNKMNDFRYVFIKINGKI